jgi:glucan 1,3-beta-glucosidase
MGHLVGRTSGDCYLKLTIGIGNGVADDTATINNAVSDGNRCGLGCDSSITVPALIYFPQGPYRVSLLIITYYFSQLEGDALQPPRIKAIPSFNGNALLDWDVYVPNGYGAEWYTHQNDFYRQIRNFVLDITLMPPEYGS